MKILFCLGTHYKYLISINVLHRAYFIYSKRLKQMLFEFVVRFNPLTLRRFIFKRNPETQEACIRLAESLACQTYIKLVRSALSIEFYKKYIYEQN